RMVGLPELPGVPERAVVIKPTARAGLPAGRQIPMGRIRLRQVHEATPRFEFGREGRRGVRIDGEETRSDARAALSQEAEGLDPIGPEPGQDPGMPGPASVEVGLAEANVAAR